MQVVPGFREVRRDTLGRPRLSTTLGARPESDWHAVTASTITSTADRREQGVGSPARRASGCEVLCDVLASLDQ